MRFTVSRSIQENKKYDDHLFTPDIVNKIGSTHFTPSLYIFPSPLGLRSGICSSSPLPLPRASWLRRASRVSVVVSTPPTDSVSLVVLVSPPPSPQPRILPGLLRGPDPSL